MTVLHACAFFHIREKYTYTNCLPNTIKRPVAEGGERYE